MSQYIIFTDLSKNHVLRQMRWRLLIISFMILLGFMVLVGRLINVVFFPHESLRLVSQTPWQPTPISEKHYARAPIHDRNGYALALNMDTQDVFVKREEAADYKTIARDLAPILNMDENWLFERMTNVKRSRRILLKVAQPPNIIAAIKQKGHGSVIFEKSEKRAFIYSNQTSHFLGFPSNIEMMQADGREVSRYQGLRGFEKAFDERLRNKPDAPLRTTLDVRLQVKLHERLSNSLTKFSAIGAGGLVMNIKTGDVLALVSLPDYDPDIHHSADNPALRNYMTDKVNELGSVAKVINTALYLEQGGTLDDIFDATEPLKVGPNRITDYRGQERPLHVSEIFLHSSNIGSARMADLVGPIAQRSFYYHLNFDHCAPLPIASCSRNILPDEKNWNQTASKYIAFGHNISVTPMSMALAYAGILNDGMAIIPRLTLEPMMEFANFDETNPFMPKQLVSLETSQKIRQLMRYNAIVGSAKQADVKGYLVGGKTGTAEKPNLTGKKEDDNKKINSFIAAFPMNDPTYLIYILLDEPKGIKETQGFSTAGWNAVPLAGEVIRDMIALYALPPYAPEYDMAGRWMLQIDEVIYEDKKG